MNDSTALPRVLVTGANRGIGREIALALAPDHHLVLGGRDEAALTALAAELPAAETFVADLTDPAATAAAVGALALPGGLDGLVHSAGVLVSGRVEDLSTADWTRSLTVNVTAVAELTRLLLPALREIRGTVVTINSGSGYTAKGGGGAYAASKFALRALTDALRDEERGHGVRVTSVHPGRVATDMQRQLRDFEQGEYRESDYVAPATVAATVRLALDLPAEASIDELSVRPR
ncbi:SDR family oxidoreductase [Brachybacterium sp. NBEC-018]|uniref:SDR family oxidoreductase n=1 Tax=Brachybacterium sp. NBEC-018 TaxID=2996004 RepID=UPI0021752D6C|nr:SDR family oxidoreductase [Brachybacterium sp. NBEC-018]UVY85273.1 SDR family oxidoreductase [Brachybacterium sp. NBEC-018]